MQGIDPRLLQISPHWYRRFLKTKTLSGLKRAEKIHIDLGHSEDLNLEHYGSCMVGEAYGFGSIYENKMLPFNKENAKYCKRCTSISKRIWYPVKKPYTPNAEKYLKRVIKEFCTHVEREHGN